MSESRFTPEVANTTLVSQIWKTLEISDGRENISSTQRLRQREVLVNLSSDFEMEMRAINCVYENDVGNISGRLFEELVRADRDICPRREKTEAKLIRSIMGRPSIYNLQAGGFVREINHPDILKINDTGVITEAIEVKLGIIGPKISNQIDQFRIALIEFTKKLELIDPQKIEPQVLAQIVGRLRGLRVSKDLIVTLVFPAKVYDGNVESLIYRNGYTNLRKYNAAKEIISKCRIKESPFTRNDLQVITSSTTSWFNHMESPRSTN